jgi:hypothetical protein
MDVEKLFKKMFQSAFKRVGKKLNIPKEHVQLALCINDNGSLKIEIWEAKEKWQNYTILDENLSLMKIFGIMDYGQIESLRIAPQIVKALLELAKDNNISADAVKVQVFNHKGDVKLVLYNGNDIMTKESTDGRIVPMILDFDEVVDLI